MSNEKKQEILKKIKDGTYVDTISQQEQHQAKMDRQLKPKKG